MSEDASTPEEASSSSWSDLLAQLVRSFVLMRDVFGYVLPGALFLLIGALLGHPPMFEHPADFPGAESHPWLLMLVLVVVSYFAGQFIITISYLIEDVPRILTKAWYKLTGKTGKMDTQRAQDNADFLRLHREFPDIYIEHDRQSIIALLRRGLAASVVLGILVFRYLYMHPVKIIAAAGGIMLFNAVSGYFYMKDLKRDTLQAARDAEIRRPSLKRL